MYPVVRITSLDAFLAELQTYPPEGEIVRLALTSSTVPSEPLPRRRVAIDLTAVSARGEIVWLQCSFDFSLSPNGRDIWREKDRQLYDAVGPLRDLIEDYLTDQGYEVRDGVYGIPGEIKPINADLVHMHFNPESGFFERVE
jgi:hypothetical protein